MFVSPEGDILVFEYLGLFIGYVILVTLGLWILTPAIKVRSLIKVCIILPVLIWYGLFMWYTPQSILGYPTTELPPDGAVIYSYSINEPGPNEKNPGIYLWAVIPPSKNGKYAPQASALLKFWSKFLDPRKVCKEDKTGMLRSFVLPYTRGTHRELRKFSQQALRNHGFLIFRRAGFMKRQGGSNDGNSNIDKRQNKRGKFDVTLPGQPDGALKDYEKHLRRSN